MQHRSHLPLTLILAFLIIPGCSTTQVVHDPDPEHVATAKHFLHNIGAGELAMAALRNEFENMTKEQPGMAELARRAFANFKAEDFEELAARIYSRHLTHKHLTEIAQFSEKPSIVQFFQLIFKEVAAGRPVNENEIMSQFNADELTEIIKFSQSDSFIVMNESLPEINRELSEAGRQLGEDTLRKYIGQQ